MTWTSTLHRWRGVAVRLGNAIPAPARHVAGLARGTVVAQIVMLLAIPFLARLYGIEAFGVFGVFSTASTALAVAAAGRFEQAIIPARAERDAIALAHVSLAIIVMASAALGCTMLAARPVFTSLVPSPEMRAALYWLPLGVATQAIGQVLLQWATRLHRDAVIARFYGERAIIMTAAQITFGVIMHVVSGASGPAAPGASGMAQNGLVLGQIVGFAGAALLLRSRLPKLFVIGNARTVTIRAVRIAKTNFDFPRYGLPRTLTEAAATIAMPILVAALFGAAAMGGYWMAFRILGLPGAVVGEPVRQIFFRKAAERRRAGLPLMPLTVRTALTLSMITLPFAAILLVASQTIFALVLGPSWALAAVFVKIMAFGWIAYFVAGLFPAVVILLGLQKQHFMFEIGLRTAEAAAILVGYLTGGILVSLALWAAVNVLYVAALLWFLNRRDIVAGARAAPAGGAACLPR